MKTILSYLKNLRAKMGLVLFIKIFGTVSELLLPYILSHILKNVIEKGIKSIVLWGVVMIVCSGIACICNIIANRMAAAVSKVFAKNMRNDLFRKTLYLSAHQTDEFTIPSLESRITSDTYNVHNFVNMMQRMGVRAPILLLGGLGITMIMDMRLALVMIATLPFMFATIFCISSKGIPLYTKVQQSVDRMIRVVREDVGGMRVIKALSKSDYEHKRYDKVNKELIRKETRAGVIMGTVNPIMSTLMNIGSVGVIALGAYWVGKVEDTKKAMEELKIEWPVILDAQAIPTDLYGISGIPHIILFAPDGTIVSRGKQGKALIEAVNAEMAK